MATEQRRRWRLSEWSFHDMRPKVLGVVAALVLAATMGSAYAIGELGVFQDRYALSAAFEDGGGLRTGAQVRLAGVDVGEVTDVRPDFELGQVLVRFEVDRDVDLGPDTRARIVPNTVLGGFYLRLSGLVEEPFLGDLDEQARRIPLERTSISFTVVDTLESATSTVEELDLDVLDAVIVQIADLVEADQDEYLQLLDRLTDFAGLVSTREDELRDLLERGRELTATLRTRDVEVLELADTAGRVIDRLVARRDQLAALLGDGSAAVDRLSAVLRDHRVALQAVFDDLAEVLEVTDRRTDELNRGLPLLPRAIDEIADAGNQGDWIDVLIEDLTVLELP